MIDSAFIFYRFHHTMGTLRHFKLILSNPNTFNNFNIKQLLSPYQEQEKYHFYQELIKWIKRMYSAEK